MSLSKRIDFLKELLTESDKEVEDRTVDSVRFKALNFLNSLEYTLHDNVSKMAFDIKLFEHIFKVREFLRMPGSSTKTLMESVALITPVL